jgi:hypothetical protein
MDRPRPPSLRPAWPALALALAASCAFAPGGFSFSQPDDEEQARREARENRIAVQLSTPCRAELRNKKIMVVIGEERSDGHLVAQQQSYGPHFEAINRRLRALGLRTYTPEEIRRQVAQAAIAPTMRNDPDAALSASKRLGASFVLRGLIRSEATRNLVVAVNQVSVTMGFTLAGSDGRPVATAEARTQSYAGADVARMALSLVNEEADAVVASLYADYCRQAGLGAASRPAPKQP